MDWFKMRTIWGASLCRLSDAEAGRFIKALFAFVRSGEEYNGTGKEELLVAQALETLRGEVAEYRQQEAIEQKRKAEKSEKCRQSALARWQKNDADSCERMQMHANRTNRMQTHANRMENQNKNVLDVVEDNAPAREEGPFGLTEEDVHASITRDAQIEDAARSVGLQVTEAGMIRARGLMDKYGFDNLLGAIPLSVDHPSWAYVEGILRKGVDKNGHPGNRGKPESEVRTCYDFLRNDAV